MATGTIASADTTSLRYQKGTLSLKHGSWYAVMSLPAKSLNGSQTSPGRRWVHLGAEEDYPKKSDIQPVFDAFRVAYNQALGFEDKTPHLLTYIEKVYFPGLRLAKSTIDGYHDCLKHARDRLGDLTLGSTRPKDVRSLLELIVEEDDVSKTTTAHIKHFLSGVFTFARNKGDFDGANPVQGVKLPNARRGEETYAYSIDEELAMLDALKEDSRSLTAISLAAWSGVSRSELEALRWEDRRDGHLHVARSCVEGDLKDTKTVHRKASVPIIPVLEKVLNNYHKSLSSPTEGWMFPSENPGRPMRMNNLYRRHIEVTFKKKGITWQGWHAFRRGLATNLSELGVPDNVIQKILRHGDIEVTQKNYRKTRNPKVDAGMKKLSAALRRTKHAVDSGNNAAVSTEKNVVRHAL